MKKFISDYKKFYNIYFTWTLQDYKWQWYMFGWRMRFVQEFMKITKRPIGECISISKYAIDNSPFWFDADPKEFAQHFEKHQFKKRIKENE